MINLNETRRPSFDVALAACAVTLASLSLGGCERVPVSERVKSLPEVSLNDILAHPSEWRDREVVVRGHAKVNSDDSTFANLGRVREQRVMIIYDFTDISGQKIKLIDCRVLSTNSLTPFDERLPSEELMIGVTVRFYSEVQKPYLACGINRLGSVDSQDEDWFFLTPVYFKANCKTNLFD